MKYHVRVNVKVERVSTTLRFTHDLSYLASNLLTHAVFTCLNTLNLRESGNPP